MSYSYVDTYRLTVEVLENHLKVMFPGQPITVNVRTSGLSYWLSFEGSSPPGQSMWHCTATTTAHVSGHEILKEVMLVLTWRFPKESKKDQYVVTAPKALTQVCSSGNGG